MTSLSTINSQNPISTTGAINRSRPTISPRNLLITTLALAILGTTCAQARPTPTIETCLHMRHPTLDSVDPFSEKFAALQTLEKGSSTLKERQDAHKTLAQYYAATGDSARVREHASKTGDSKFESDIIRYKATFPQIHFSFGDREVRRQNLELSSLENLLLSAAQVSFPPSLDKALLLTTYRDSLCFIYNWEYEASQRDSDRNIGVGHRFNLGDTKSIARSDMTPETVGIPPIEDASSPPSAIVESNLDTTALTRRQEQGATAIIERPQEQYDQCFPNASLTQRELPICVAQPECDPSEAPTNSGVFAGLSNFGTSVLPPLAALVFNRFAPGLATAAVRTVSAVASNVFQAIGCPTRRQRAEALVEEEAPQDDTAEQVQEAPAVDQVPQALTLEEVAARKEELQARLQELRGPTGFDGQINTAWEQYIDAKKNYATLLALQVHCVMDNSNKLEEHEARTIDALHPREGDSELDRMINGLMERVQEFTRDDPFLVWDHIGGVDDASKVRDRAYENYRGLDQERLQIQGELQTLV